MQNTRDWNVFVGSKTGILKGLNISWKGVKAKNLIKVKVADNKKEIACLNWANEEETEILIGYTNQAIKIYDTQLKCFSYDGQLNCGEGTLKGLLAYSGRIVTAVESGEVKQWDMNTKAKLEDKLDCGKDLETMCQNKDDRKCIATGGKENELKIWDLEKCTTTFTAKNVRHDELELRVPVWVSDATFLPQSSKVAVSTRYGFVRLYDPNSNFRRPVSSVTIPDQALTCIAPSSREDHVLVGSGTGHMFLVDLRNKGVLLNHYKGFVGGIRKIACSRNEPYIVSVGLDRHVRVHNLNSKQLIFKEYLQSRLTSVLLRSDFTITEPEDEIEDEIKSETDSIIGDDIDFSNRDFVLENIESARKRKLKKQIAKHKKHKKPRKKYIII